MVRRVSAFQGFSDFLGVWVFMGLELQGLFFGVSVWGVRVWGLGSRTPRQKVEA